MSWESERTGCTLVDEPVSTASAATASGSIPASRNEAIDSALSRFDRPSPDAVAERLSWWAELFEPPCVGYAASREEASEFVMAGADFVLVDDLVWADPRGAAPALADLDLALRQAYAAASKAAKAVQG